MSKTLFVEQRVQQPELASKFLQLLLENPPSSWRQLEKAKYRFSAVEKITTLQNRDLLAMARQQNLILPNKLASLLQKRAVRTISGVTPVGVLTKPFPCPGRCVYCPTEARMPKSYLSTQPAAARAVRNNFHPYRQVSSRLLALYQSGHPVSKLEIIVMGGTWSFLPKNYQNWYLRQVYAAANDFMTNNTAKNTQTAKQPRSLRNLQKINETSPHRIVGLTLETRPDFINPDELQRMRKYGCTRVEIGVQTLDDRVQKLTKRGHTRRQVIRATKLLKDFGFKVCYHLMPGLPGSTPEKDLVWLKEVFDNPDFCPDFVKIYPCMVLDTAELKSWWQDGTYKPYDDATLVKLLLQMHTFVPEWVRVMRMMRDIPLDDIVAGAKLSNLRQIIQEQPEKLRKLVGEDFLPADWSYRDTFRDIRVREIGFAEWQDPQLAQAQLRLVRRQYSASDGTEIFLSWEDQDQKHLYALLRLRRDPGQSASFRPKVLDGAALIREVHSYGSEKAVGDSAGQGQHRGLGKTLIQEAERIASQEWHAKKIAIIAGVGTREYYRKFGYTLHDTYMIKKIT